MLFFFQKLMPPLQVLGAHSARQSSRQDRLARGPDAADPPGGLASLPYCAPAEGRPNSSTRTIGVSSSDRIRTALLVQAQVDGVADECEMRESLGKIAEEGIVLRIDFLGEESDVVGFSDQALEELPGLFFPSERKIGIHQPEAADEKGSLPAFQPVFGAVALDVISPAKLALDRGNRPLEHSSFDRKAQHGHQQQGGIGPPVIIRLQQVTTLGVRAA